MSRVCLGFISINQYLILIEGRTKNFHSLHVFKNEKKSSIGGKCLQGKTRRGEKYFMFRAQEQGLV